MTASWDALAERMISCRACPELAAARTHVVVGDRPPGWPQPRPGTPSLQAPGTGTPAGGGGLALVGEAPGAQEDAAGHPFVGRAGQLLDQLLREACLRRDEVAVLNVVKCRPPGNRAPKADEIERCRPYLDGQLEALRPGLVVALGLTAAGWFLGRRTTLASARGRVHRVEVGGVAYRVLVTYHPSAAIRFGPRGAPLAALREDLALAAKLLVGSA
jgi:uracil-DNA glycosylase family 4